MTRHRIRASITLISAAATLLVSGCATSDNDPAREESHAAVRAGVAPRIAEIADAVDQWQTASTVEAALTAAEATRNLVVGPGGPGYGDTNDDGATGGASERGLLPTSSGRGGIASQLSGTCAAPDILGGSWSDPVARWDEFDDVLGAWSSSDNTMPQLTSHAQRIVGWAALATTSADLDQIQEYAGHASIHVDVLQDALECIE